MTTWEGWVFPSMWVPEVELNLTNLYSRHCTYRATSLPSGILKFQNEAMHGEAELLHIFHRCHAWLKDKAELITGIKIICCPTWLQYGEMGLLISI